MFTCGRCRRELAEDRFYRSKGKVRTAWCKDCYRDWYQERYALKEPVPVGPRTCDWCGNEYQMKQRRPSRFCSRRCKDKSRHAKAAGELVASKPENRICVHCGDTLPQEMRVDAKFCSSKCNSAAHHMTRKMAKRANSKRDGVLFSLSALGERDGWRCGLCGGRINRAKKHPDPLAPSVDHIVPLAAGGSNEVINLQITHLRCNLRKRDSGSNQLRLLG